MIVILEGTDGVGKTTLANHLAAKLEAKLIHASAPTHDHWMEEYVEPLLDGDDYVLDRWHIGERVWPAVFGRTSLFAQEDSFARCNHVLRALGARVVYLTRNTRGIHDALVSRGETARHKYDEALAGQARYADAIKETKEAGLPVFEFDYQWITNPDNVGRLGDFFVGERWLRG